MLPRSGAFTSVVRFIVHMFCCKKLLGEMMLIFFSIQLGAYLN